VLIHFSLRYSDEDICGFFRDPLRSGIVLESTDLEGVRPPDLVLWLDSGVVPLWVAAFGLDADAAPRSSGAAAGHQGTAGGEHAAAAGAAEACEPCEPL
jgi:hypothetical protein